MTDTVETSWAQALTDLQGAANNDRILFADGTYNVGATVQTVDKTSTSAIVKFMAQNRGRAILTGRGINLATANIIFEGFDLQFSDATNDIDYVAVNGDNCSMIGNDIHFGDPGLGIQQKWIHDKANNFTFNYNKVHGKRCIDDMFLMDKSTTVAISGLQCKYNDFYDFIQNPGDTKSEVIRIGQSAMAMMDFDAEIANNRIWGMDADTEVVSVKASGVNFHHNYCKDLLGSIVLRQAHDCQVEDNVIVNGGLRFYGHGHIIRRNKIIDNSVGGVSNTMFIGPGDVEEYQKTGGGNASPGEIIPVNANYARTHDCYIEFNEIDNGSVANNNHLLLGGEDASVGSLPPINNHFRYNQHTASVGTFTHKRGNISAEWTANDCVGNIFYVTGSAAIGDMPSSGYIAQVPTLQLHADGKRYRSTNVMQTKNKDVGPWAYHYV